MYNVEKYLRDNKKILNTSKKLGIFKYLFQDIGKKLFWFFKQNFLWKLYTEYLFAQSRHVFIEIDIYFTILHFKDIPIHFC